MSNGSVLYWPGRGQDLDVLSEMQGSIADSFNFNVFDIRYDVGDLNPQKWEKVVNNYCEWWIGISLGASLLYHSLHFVKTKKPTRVTLINPFSSRKLLSEEKGFDLNNQWEFSPIDAACSIDKIDVVLSVYDKKIPIYHGIDLLNKTFSKEKRLIFVDDNHTINNTRAQLELAKILMGKNIVYGDDEIEKTYYCHVYKQ